MQRLSVVIPNYNYQEFVTASIESALSLEWPDVEVIVVDDGSTDDSRARIASFGNRITFLKQENAGPREACNTGFAASTGDVVIFLDSDDLLHPSVAREIAGVWRPGISKVQMQMERIDAQGVAIGSVFPEYRSTPTPDDVRYWVSETSAYPTPPGSGNAYARQFLEQLFPLDGRCGDATDSACLAAAPYLGDVVTVPLPLVGYRVHGRNRSDLLADPARFTRQVERAYQRHLFALEISATRLEGQKRLRALFRGRHLLQLRIAELRVRGGRRPIPTDNFFRMLRNSFGALTAPGPESIPQRFVIWVWTVAALLAPTGLAHGMIRARFDPTIRGRRSRSRSVMIR